TLPHPRRRAPDNRRSNLPLRQRRARAPRCHRDRDPARRDPRRPLPRAMTTIDDYLEASQNAHLDSPCELLRIPSVSTDPAHAEDVARAAEWVADDLRAMSFATEVIPTAGHPIVYAEWLGAPGKPTVLIYGHYDVQPPDPVELWRNPPFEPTIEGGNIVAR